MLKFGFLAKKWWPERKVDSLSLEHCNCDNHKCSCPQLVNETGVYYNPPGITVLEMLNRESVFQDNSVAVHNYCQGQIDHFGRAY